MKANETQSDNAASANVKLLIARQHGSGQYQKVFDARKRRLRGLWERNGTFYGQLTITDPATGSQVVRRVRLEDKGGNPVTTTPQAVAVLNKMKGQREDDNLKIAPKRTPTLSDYGKTYTARLVRNDNRAARLVQLIATYGARDLDDPQPALNLM